MRFGGNEMWELHLQPKLSIVMNNVFTSWGFCEMQSFLQVFKWSKFFDPSDLCPPIGTEKGHCLSLALSQSQSLHVVLIAAILVTAKQRPQSFDA